MKTLNIFSPVKTPNDIEIISKKTACKDFYVYYHKFLNNKFDYIKEFLKISKRNNCRIFVNFKHDIKEENLPEIENFIKYLKKTNIDGIFVNNFAVLEIIKKFSLPFKVIADSYFDIHNISGIDFINNFHKVSGVILTEEIYAKNIAKIKKYSNLSLAIDSDNLPWCIEDIQKTKAVDDVIIKGKFRTSEEILEGVTLIENIIKNPKIYKNQKLPFKHVRKSTYQTNHFSGDMISAKGKDFKFSRNIQSFDWELKRSYLKAGIKYKKPCDYRINLRLSSLEQLKQLKKFNDKIGFNIVDSIEYGEILSTSDLAKKNFNQVIKEAKTFCQKENIDFQLSTPRILIERDFDRVYEYEKQACLNSKTSSLIINNIGYFQAVINDCELNQIPLEIGQGINLLNSMSIKCLNNLKSIKAVDFTTFNDIEKTLKEIKDIIEIKKYTIAGNIRIPSLGLCPLNSDSAINSRLSCKAPCQKGQFALKDPSLKKVIPFTVDGFCRMHMFEDKIVERYDEINTLKKAGINEFVFDFSSLDAKFIPVIITNFLNYLYS